MARSTTNPESRAKCRRAWANKNFCFTPLACHFSGVNFVVHFGSLNQRCRSLWSFIALKISKSITHPSTTLTNIGVLKKVPYFQRVAFQESLKHQTFPTKKIGNSFQLSFCLVFQMFVLPLKDTTNSEKCFQVQTWQAPSLEKALKNPTKNHTAHDYQIALINRI